MRNIQRTWEIKEFNFFELFLNKNKKWTWEIWEQKNYQQHSKTHLEILLKIDYYSLNLHPSKRKQLIMFKSKAFHNIQMDIFSIWCSVFVELKLRFIRNDTARVVIEFSKSIFVIENIDTSWDEGCKMNKVG